MAATKIQTVASTTTLSTGSTLTFASNVVVGRTITVIAVSLYASCIPTLTDNLGNTYTRVVNGAASGGGKFLSAFTAPVTVGGACTITITMACSSIPVMFASEMTGLAASPFESYNLFNNTTSPIYAGSVTPTVNGSYLMAVFLDNATSGAITQGSAWTDQGAFSGGRRCQDLIQTTAAAINADATSGTAGNITGYVVVFKAAAATPVLIITTQPTTTASGNPISPSVVVKATTDGSTVDTAATGACVGTLPGGAMYGTTTLNFTAGVATFSALVPGGAARSDALHFASTGYTAVDSASFSITSGSGSTIRTYEERIVRPIKVAEATNTRRRIALRLVDTANAATAVSMTGRKAQLSSAGGAETASTADITQVGTTSRGYVELSLAEATALTAGDYVEARVVAATGLAEYVGCADVFPDDPYAAALTSTSIANATVEAEITALKTYARGTNTSYAITGPTSGVNSRTITTDGSYLPFKSA